jgi:hypothetical protein
MAPKCLRLLLERGAHVSLSVFEGSACGAHVRDLLQEDALTAMALPPSSVSVVEVAHECVHEVRQQPQDDRPRERVVSSDCIHVPWF